MVFPVIRAIRTIHSLQTFVVLIIGTLISYSQLTAQVTNNPFSNLEEISLKNSTRLQQIATMDGVQSGYSVSPDDQEIAVAYPDGVRIYEMGSFADPVLFFPIKDAFEVYAPVFSPDKNHLSITFIPNGEKKSITQVWNIEMGKVEYTFSTDYFSLNTYGAHFSPNGRYLIGNARAYYPDRSPDKQPNEGYGDLYVWDLEAGRVLCDPITCSPRYGISDFTFTPDSQNILWGFPDRTLEGNFAVYWNFIPLRIDSSDNISSYLMNYLSEGTGPFSLDVQKIEFVPKGNILVSVSPLYAPNQKTRFWDVQSGKQLNIRFDDNFDLLGFFDDQVVMISDLRQNTVSLFNIYTNEAALLFRHMPENIRSLKVGSTKKLFTTWYNNQVNFWGIPKVR